MKRRFLCLVFLFLITILSYLPAASLASSKQENLIKHQEAKPGFIENKVQIIEQKNNLDPAVHYLLNTPGMNVQVRKAGFSNDIYNPTTNLSPRRKGSFVKQKKAK